MCADVSLCARRETEDVWPSEAMPATGLTGNPSVGCCQVRRPSHCLDSASWRMCDFLKCRRISKIDCVRLFPLGLSGLVPCGCFGLSLFCAGLFYMRIH